MNIELDFRKNGYVILKDFFFNDFVSNAKKVLDKLEPKVLYPFSEEAWGFGDLSSTSPFNQIPKKSS